MKYENKTLSLVVDMYGCPNRCKHCWIAHMPNGNMSDQEAEALVEYFKPHFDVIEFYSWAREPDYKDNYRERWEKDKQLSINIVPQRFELASFWRLVRDESYASFLQEVGVPKVQLTFFGLEETTDCFVGRKGAFKELLKATEILLEHKIAPRWQVFIYEHNKEEVVSLLHLSQELRLKERCEAFGQEFEFFIHAGSCEGNNYKLYDQRICKDSMNPILHSYFSDYENNYSEAELCEMYKEDTSTLKLSMGDQIVLYILGNGNIHYNFGSIEEIWKIGNWKTDNKEELLEKIVHDDAWAVKIANSITIKELIEKYGDKNSTRLFVFDDYKMYLLNKHLYYLSEA